MITGLLFFVGMNCVCGDIYGLRCSCEVPRLGNPRTKLIRNYRVHESVKCYEAGCIIKCAGEVCTQTCEVICKKQEVKPCIPNANGSATCTR